MADFPRKSSRGGAVGVPAHRCGGSVAHHTTATVADACPCGAGLWRSRLPSTRGRWGWSIGSVLPNRVRHGDDDGTQRANDTVTHLPPWAVEVGSAPTTGCACACRAVWGLTWHGTGGFPPSSSRHSTSALAGQVAGPSACVRNQREHTPDRPPALVARLSVKCKNQVFIVQHSSIH